MRGDRIRGPIRWRMHLPAAPAEVYRALDSDEGRAAFCAESAREVDGCIEFRFVGGMTHRGAILERSPARSFCVDYMGGPARFELAPDGAGGTDLLLTHEGVAEDEGQEVHAGWLNVLFPLKAWVAHGVDLRNHDPASTREQGYADS